MADRSHFLRRPAFSECNAFYHDYLRAAPDGDVIASLVDQGGRLQAAFEQLSDEQLQFAYKPGKWTPLQILGHLVDSERLFTYRAMRFVRGDQTELPGLDQDVLMDGARFEERGLASVLAEFRGLRSSTVALYDSFSADDLERAGTASGYRFTVRALVWLTLGHVAHHRNVLGSKYGFSEHF